MQIKLLIVCLIFSHVAFGQFVAGKKMLQTGFDLGISVNGNDKNAINTFNSHDIRVSIGSGISYIQSETQQWGFSGNFSFTDNVANSTNKNNLSSTFNTSHSTGFSLSPTIFRIHLKKLMPSLYGGFRYYGSIGYSMSKNNNTNEFTSTVSQPASTTSTSSTKQNSVNAGIGLTSQFYYFITPKWGLSANIGYIDMSFGRSLESKNWSFNTYSGFNNFAFGLFKILDK
jgi:hypothetical protein